MVITIGLFLVVLALLASHTIVLIYFKRYIEGEDNRMMRLYDSAMSYLKATSLEAKVRIDADKEKLAVDLQAYRDAVAQAAAEVETPGEPVPAKTSDGRTIDLRDWEVQ